jgi:hypothetical protein
MVFNEFYAEGTYNTHAVSVQAENNTLPHLANSHFA